MKKALQKTSIFILALLMILSTAAGCSNKTGVNDSTGNTSAQEISGSSTAGTEIPSEQGMTATGYVKYDPVVTITTARTINDAVKFRDGETIDDNVFTRWAKDKLGIEIKHLWTTPPTNDAFRMKLMLLMSANEALPDFFNVPGSQAHELIDSGKFQPVDELFDKYASAEWKRAMDEVPNAWMPYVRDGKKYALPGIDYIMQHDDAMWIRQDWLEKLGLQAPKTIEELEKVMDAFANNDPDGNNTKDTYGLTVAMKANYNAWIGAGAIFGAYGAVPQIWQKDQSGEILYGSVRPEIKQTLGKFKDWITKGYVHKEIGLHDETKAYELFTSGKAGIAFGPTWLYSWPLADVEKNVSGAKVWPYPLPAGPDGKIGQASEGSHYQVALINKDMKNPEAFFTYSSYLFDFYNDPKVGGEFEFGFAKGYDYEEMDGKIVFGNDVPGGSIDVTKFFPTIPPRTPSMLIKTLAELADGKEPVTPFEKKNATSPKQQLEAAKVVYGQRQYTLDNLFTGNPTSTMKDKLANLQTMENEAFSKIIYGKVDLDYFDEFVKNWYSAGGEQITQEVREWYTAAGGN